MGDPDLDRLAGLVGDVERFAAEHWGRAPMHRPSGLDLTALLDIAAVEALLLAPARRPTFRLVRDGEVLGTERSTRPVRVGGTRLDDVADLGRIAEAVHDGATVVVQSLQRTWPPLVDLCRSLERATSHPVQANAYLSPAGAAGLARHHDTHDVLVLQVSGSKRWEVEGLGTVTTVAGDVLYQPAGTAHSAAAGDEPSLHLTLGLLRETVGGLLRRALAADHLDVDAPLPLGFAREELRGEALGFVAGTLAGAAGALAALDPGTVLDAEVDRARRRRRPRLTGHLDAVLHLDRIGDATVVTARPDQPATLEPATAPDGRIVLRLADRRLHLPADTAPAIARLLTGDPVAVADLPGLSPAGRLVLVRRLVREELLAVGGAAGSPPGPVSGA